MGNLHGRIPTQALDQQQSDKAEYRRRVATWIDGNTVGYEDGNFTVADDQIILDAEADLGRKGHAGYFVNDGPGDIKVSISFDGTAYGSVHTLRGGDTLSLDDLNISRIRLTHVDDTEFRCLIG